MGRVKGIERRIGKSGRVKEIERRIGKSWVERISGKSGNGLENKREEWNGVKGISGKSGSG